MGRRYYVRRYPKQLGRHRPAASDPRAHDHPKLVVESPPQPRRPPPTRIIPPSRRPRIQSATTAPSALAASPISQQTTKYVHAAAVITATSLYHNYETAARHFTGAVLDPATGNLCEIGALLKGSEGAAWEIASANEIGWLAQGVGTEMLKGMNTICFTPHDNKTKNKKATYIRIVATNQLQKAEKKRI